MPAIEITRHCIWCNAKMKTKRADKRVCSSKCQNEMSYVHRRDYGWLTNEEFRQVIHNHMENGTHINPDHPMAKLDAALADFIRATTAVIEAATEQEEGVFNA